MDPIDAGFSPLTIKGTKVYYLGCRYFYCKDLQLRVINQSGCFHIKNVHVCLFNDYVVGNIQEDGNL